MSEASSPPLATSQSLILSSALPDASLRPSGLNATELTELVCPARVRNSCPLATSQSLTEWSRLPESKVCPSGLKATDATDAECPVCTTSSGFWACVANENVHQSPNRMAILVSMICALLEGSK